MKKLFISLIVLIACVALIFGLSACNFGADNNKGSGTQDTQVPDDDKNNGQKPDDDNIGQEVNKKYKVEFDSNGGNNVASKEYVEGEALSELPLPQRKGYEFKGWFDADKLYDDKSIMPSKNLTLTAKWEQIIKEYSVTFVLNYSDEEDVVKYTEKGYITFVPEREGYIFNGWWLSDGLTDGGYILSQKFDVSKVVKEENLVLYAEWVEETDNYLQPQLSAPTVTFNESGKFSWQEINGATCYQIIVCKAGSTDQEYNKSITLTSWSFALREAGYYTIKIRAIGDGYNTVNSPYVEKSYAYRILSSVTNVSFNAETSCLSWEKVKHATYYNVVVDGELAETVSGTNCDMVSYEAGEHVVRVTAEASGYVSSSTSLTIRKIKLKTPVVTMTKSDGTGSPYYKFEWQPVSHADTYILSVNGNDIKITECSYRLYNGVREVWGDANIIDLKISAFDSNYDYLVSDGKEYTLAKLFEIKISCNVDLSVGRIKYGERVIENSYQTIVAEYGEQALLISEMHLGYVFRDWTDENGKLISSDSSYSFTVTEDRNLRACITMDDALQFITIESDFTTCTITMAHHSNSDVIIPDYVTKIDNAAFFRNTDIVHLIINGNTEIDMGAFWECTNLNTVTLGDGVTVIGNSAFYRCTSLTELKIGDNVTEIKDSAFWGCETLKSVKIGKKVKTIGKLAFSGCNVLKEVYYKGDATSFKRIRIDDSGNTPLKRATKYYYSETQPTMDGNFWYYGADNEIIIWKKES